MEFEFWSMSQFTSDAITNDIKQSSDSAFTPASLNKANPKMETFLANIFLKSKQSSMTLLA